MLSWMFTCSFDTLRQLRKLCKLFHLFLLHLITKMIGKPFNALIDAKTELFINKSQEIHKTVPLYFVWILLLF